MKRYVRRIMTLLTAFATALVIVVIPTGAALAATTDVSGVANWAEECNGRTSDWTLVLEGDLSGCLYTSIETGEELPGGVYIETGTEIIVACTTVGEEEACGTFSTTYRFYGVFADDGTQLFGKCHHPIVTGSGTGGFSGISGRLGFKDNVETGEAFYTGTIDLP